MIIVIVVTVAISYPLPIIGSSSSSSSSSSSNNIIISSIVIMFIITIIISRFIKGGAVETRCSDVYDMMY